METINELTEQIIGAAIEVHRQLGPGLLESAYQRAMELELEYRGLLFEAQKYCPIQYRNVEISDAYRVDLLVNQRVVVELKSTEGDDDVHVAQVLTYLRFTGCKIGLLINFKNRILIDGLRRLSL